MPSDLTTLSLSLFIFLHPLRKSHASRSPVLIYSMSLQLAFVGEPSEPIAGCSFVFFFPRSSFRKRGMGAGSRTHIPRVALANDRSIPRRPHPRCRRRSRLEAFPLGSTPVLTMRSPAPGAAVSKLGFAVPPQTTAFVTTHWPFLVESTSCQPSRFLPLSRGFHPPSTRNGGSPWPLPSATGGRS